MERKEKILEFLKDDRYPPVNIEEMMLMLDIPFDDREELSLILAELVEDGLIVKTNKRKYASPEKLGYTVGKFSANERGFGFVLKDGGDLFIEWPEQKNIFMTGLAQAVFSGEDWGE